MIRGQLSDEEWAFFAPFVIEAGPLRGRPPLDHRRVLDAIFWITRTGAPWRDLPDELGNWNSVHRQFRRVRPHVRPEPGWLAPYCAGEGCLHGASLSSAQGASRGAG